MTSAGTTRGSKWPVFFSSRKFYRLFAIVFGMMPILPVLALFLAYSFQMASHPADAASTMTDRQLMAATANSGTIALLASFMGAVIALLLVLFLKSYKGVAILILCLLFVPGRLVAHGYDVIAAKFVLSHVTYLATFGALSTALIGYVLPFQALIAVMASLGIRDSEKYAAREYFVSQRDLAIYWLGRLRNSIVAMLVIGFALAFTEYPRTQDLGRDFFGFGGAYFGPLIVGRYTTQGIPDLYIFVASVVVAGALALVGRAWLSDHAPVGGSGAIRPKSR